MPGFIEYSKVQFTLRFDQPVKTDNDVAFVLRGILGSKLRSLCCVTGKKDCTSCNFANGMQCAYVFLFETILNKSNSLHPGRNRASHPYAFTRCVQIPPGSRITDYPFEITLFGKASGYLPYIYAAFVQGGKSGMFKSRTPFSVISVKDADGSELLSGEDSIKTCLLPRRWEFPSAPFVGSKSGQVLAVLKTPMRFKTKGRYTDDFDAAAFMSCLYRRAKTMCQLYGEWEEEQTVQGMSFPGIRIAEKSLHWKDTAHWSGRQKQVMELGGLLGTVRLEGTFSPLDQAVLEFNQIANAGKNTIFGLGQIEFWPKWLPEAAEGNGRE